MIIVDFSILLSYSIFFPFSYKLFQAFIKLILFESTLSRFI